jgi:hypothetical protein
MPVLGAGILGQILQGILAAISAAPQIEAIVTAGKAWITALFSNGLISLDTQNILHAYVDAHWAAAKAGVIPLSWTVEPDPVTPTPAPAIKPVV